jgi:hypothetical protein
VFSFPGRATIALGSKRDKAYLMLDVVMLALGLGFFLVAVGYARACERFRGERKCFSIIHSPPSSLPACCVTCSMPCCGLSDFS